MQEYSAMLFRSLHACQPLQRRTSIIIVYCIAPPSVGLVYTNPESRGCVSRPSNPCNPQKILRGEIITCYYTMERREMANSVFPNKFFL